jgi:beta-galactosidase
MSGMKRALGVCYYPEHWDEAVWPQDAARMAEAGISWVRIGEFAWSRLEPMPGEVRLGWLDRAISVLGDAGLKVILGTPTATPPRWMLDRHPDMLPVGRDGQVRGFGSRRHYCFSHAGYRAESARITRLLAERYGENPAIAAWQTDNEYACHNTTLSYSAAAQAGFRTWLQERYGQIDNLNRAWGNVFWSMEYRTYGEIGLPNATVTEANPAQWMDFYRYSSDQVRAFNRVQVDIIRQYSDRPILHNYMGRTTDFDHFDVGADLDAASWDSYPLGFLEDRVDMPADWKLAFMRQGDPDNQAFHHDLYRAVGRGRWWVMEQQPGPVNWAPFNPAPLPGMCRLWAWEAFAHGAEVVSFFRWRQAPFAQEQMHAGLLRPDSAPAPALSETAQVARELASAPMVQPSAAQVALVFDYQAAWGSAIQPQGRSYDWFRLAFETYRGLRQNGLSIDIIPPDASDLSDYALVVAPGVQWWRPAFLAALAKYKGLFVTGPRAGAKSEAMSIPIPLPPALPGLDLTVARVSSLRDDAAVPLSGGGCFRHWQEHLETGATVLETGPDGSPAVVQGGNIRYLGGWPDRAAMLRLMGQAARDAGLPTISLPDGVRIRDTDTERFVFNYGAVPADLSAIPGIGGGAILPAADLVRINRAL